MSAHAKKQHLSLGAGSADFERRADTSGPARNIGVIPGISVLATIHCKNTRMHPVPVRRGREDTDKVGIDIGSIPDRNFHLRYFGAGFVRRESDFDSGLGIGGGLLLQNCEASRLASGPNGRRCSYADGDQRSERNPVFRQPNPHLVPRLLRGGRGATRFSSGPLR